MNYEVKINDFIKDFEVPELRKKIGWGPREYEYPKLFERCNFHASIRNDEGVLIGFGYICGMGLEHGYMEDIMIDPNYQKKGLGTKLVKKLLEEAKRQNILIISVTLDPENENFYKNCGFDIGLSGTVIY
ncbi:MAG: GNAT family N-acetyltransferase [Lagierella massiliensis]|nr:GNAT family N-acetyltransferase [Lagierella massiliensis]